ncbi:lipocalin family protein [Robertkochia solimangrovi]|uniref:lipocalin family protein n=1 Tax=Robertkochia solimangrovi TaxID=2213046 RepID=UPI001F5549E8|nr:lipocalin family protein [Robertkochia solimangrovi]
MKKHFKTLMAVTVLFTVLSCGLSKDNRSSRDTINGTWELASISYQGNEGYFKSELFGMATSKCFKNSEWFFRSNNSTGYYTLPAGECAGGTQNIRWSVQDDANGQPSKFTFKYIDEKKNDLYGGVGYVLDITSLSENSMTLTSNENVDGESIQLVYQFNKKTY